MQQELIIRIDNFKSGTYGIFKRQAVSECCGCEMSIFERLVQGGFRTSAEAYQTLRQAPHNKTAHMHMQGH